MGHGTVALWREDDGPPEQVGLGFRAIGSWAQEAVQCGSTIHQTCERQGLCNAASQAKAETCCVRHSRTPQKPSHKPYKQLGWGLGSFNTL